MPTPTEVEVQPKPFFTSKLIGLGSGLTVLGLAILAMPELRDFIATLPPEYQGGVTLVIGIAVIILRAYSSQPLTVTLPGSPADEVSG